MKKLAYIILIVLMLLFAACSNQDQPSTDAENTFNTQSDNITMLDESAWPVNKYTDGLPAPFGTVSWAMLDNEHQTCSINITDISEADYNNYLGLLKRDGFFVVEEVSEEIKGQAYVSIGILLSDNERGLSISYIPNSFTICISFEGDDYRRTD